jgi:hypothetical protein
VLDTAVVPDVAAKGTPRSRNGKKQGAVDWMGADDLFDADRPPGDLKSVLDREVVRPCLEAAFRDGELRRSETTVIEHTTDPFGGEDYGPIIKLLLETSDGDKLTITVWQPEVEQFSTFAGIREHLLRDLEDWLPETRLHWGEEIHLLPDSEN